MTSNGAALLPTWQSLTSKNNQTPFFVYLNTGLNNQVGFNFGIDVLYDTILFDLGSNITLNSGGATIFTVPVTGIYWFSIGANVNNLIIAASGISYRIHNQTTGIMLNCDLANPGANSASNTWGGNQGSLFKCTAGDKISGFIIVGGLGADTVGFTGVTIGPPLIIKNYFCGYLVAQTA